MIRRPVVAHWVPIYLPRTETFVYQVLTHHDRYQPIVVAQNRAETAALFPFPEIHVEAELRRRFSRQWWYEQLGHRLRGRSYHRYDGILERRRVEILHVHFGHTGAETIHVAERRGLPQVTAFYGWDDTVALGDPARADSFRKLFATGAAFLVEGTHIAERLAGQGCPRGRIHVHRIGIDVERIRFAPPRPTDRPRVLFCGRFVEKKGLGDALLAVAWVREAGETLELRVVGDGPLAQEIESRIGAFGLGDVVTLLGPLDYASYLAEVEAADLVIVPSRTASDGETEGGAPTVLIEAQAAGKPILTTRHADIPEIVVPGESAIVVPEGAPEALGEGLLDLLRSRGRWGAMGRSGRRHVEAEHAITHQMAKLERLYDELRDR